MFILSLEVGDLLDFMADRYDGDISQSMNQQEKMGGHG